MKKKSTPLHFGKAKKSVDEPKDQHRWKIMIVDDEEGVHTITKMVLKNFQYQGQYLEFISAYTGKEAIELIKKHPDTALIYLDVVMEKDDSGLSVARIIREEIKNKYVRIILRTGQPGQAPEEEVIVKYDINDYKEKTELTDKKLFTSTYTGIRNFNDLMMIEKERMIIEQNRDGLQEIIKASRNIFEVRSMKKFAQGVLTQLVAILRLHQDSMLVTISGLTIEYDNYDENSIQIIAGTGKYNQLGGDNDITQIPKKILDRVKQAFDESKSIFIEDAYLGYFQTSKDISHLLYVEGVENLTELDKQLIDVFSANVAIAFQNVYLNQEIENTQDEIISKLGDVVETRSKETAYHVRRIAEFSYILGEAYGLSYEQCKLLKITAPMHDIGKIAIADSILLKEGKLNADEFENIKTHTTIGYEIFKDSKYEILKTAANIALEHHERYDGKGYPKGLKGTEIDIFSRIVSVCDVFDALIHARIYKKGWKVDDATQYIKDNAGTQFDPKVVKLFIQNLDKIIEVNEKLSNVQG